MKNYPKGFYYNAPRPNSPDFVKGQISIHLESFIESVKGFVNDKGYVRLDFLKGEPKEKNESGLYFVINDYKPKQEGLLDNSNEVTNISF